MVVTLEENFEIVVFVKWFTSAFKFISTSARLPTTYIIHLYPRVSRIE